MIDREATIAKFGYDPTDLSWGSGKQVVAICKECGKVRDLEKKSYRDLCVSCATKKQFENHPMSNETQEKISASLYKHYEDHPMSDETRGRHSAATKRQFEDPAARRKQSAVQKKHYKDLVARQKHSAAIQGISYEEWERFATESPYCPAFNEACRESNREKYGRRCFICDLPESDNLDKNGKVRKLSVHHVDLNKMQGCDGHRWKLIPTCMEHHGTTHTSLWISRITYLLRNIDYNHH